MPQNAPFLGGLSGDPAARPANTSTRRSAQYDGTTPPVPDSEAFDSHNEPTGDGIGIITNLLLGGLYGYLIFFVIGATGAHFGIDPGWGDFVARASGPFDANTIFGQAYWIMMVAIGIWGYMCLQIAKKAFWIGLTLALLIPGVCSGLAWQQIMSGGWLGRFGLIGLVVFAFSYIFRMRRGREKFRIKTEVPEIA